MRQGTRDMKQGNTTTIWDSSAEKKGGAFAYKIYSAVFLVSCLMSHVSFVAHAATLGVVVNSGETAVGQPIRVDIPLDTKGDTMNAIQADISFPPGLFTLQSISDGNSMVSFWVDPPTEVASGVISFSGIVPGGFDGAASSVMGLILDPVSDGTGTISLTNVELLQNDGQGSPIQVTSTGAMVSVVGSASTTPLLPPSFSLISPELFTPSIAQDPTVYGGKYFLVFSTTDKGSGIDHYEVLEVPTGKSISSVSSWDVATSPYLLQDQDLTSDIYVRAVDHAGNSIVVKLPARSSAASKATTRLLWFGLAALIVILLIAGIFVLRRRMVR